MASVTYTFSIRDNSSTNGGLRKTALTPTWVFFKNASTLADVTPQPAIVEVAQGVYKFSCDPEVYGEITAQVDAGAALTLPGDRYLDVFVALDSSRISSGISATGKVVQDLTAVVPTTNTAGTIGDALNAARAQGFGKWALVGTTLSLYAADGTTVVRSFVLDSATAPTSRT